MDIYALFVAEKTTKFALQHWELFRFSENTSLSEPVLQEQVEKLNRQNTEHSHTNTEADVQRDKDAELILDGPQTSASQTEKRKQENEAVEDEDDGDVFVDTEPEEEDEQHTEEDGTEQSRKFEDDVKNGEARDSLDSLVSSSVSDTSNLLHER